MKKILFVLLVVGAVALYSANKEGKLNVEKYFQKLNIDDIALFDKNPNDSFEGIASYYADKYNGRLTSSGTVFSNEKLIAAHRTLPFGTKVKVTNTETMKDVIVSIEDRGPFKGGRIIDLSKKAAKEIGLLSSGLAKVKLEVLD